MPTRDYDRYRESQAALSRERSAEGRNFDRLPKVKNPKRRKKALESTANFAAAYFPTRFYLPMAPVHLLGAGMLDRVTADGGLGVCAWPRGFGKDTWTEVGVLRALLGGLRRFLVFLLATERHAARALRRIRRELETNDLLNEDFPEVCYPIRRLERITQRAQGQTYRGVPTRIEITAESLVLPTIEGSQASGATVQVYGLTGAVRGLTTLGPDGEPIRPDMVVLNDCQTRDSAKSPTQTADREAMISDDVLQLAGPTTTIAAVYLGTVIYRNDLTDRLLDPDRHPEWQKVRTRLVEKFPDDMAKWDEYGELRRAGLRDGDEGRRATAFYAADREAMDAGGVVSWPDRKKKGELSGLQSALNFYYDNPRGFWSEGQNEPKAEALADGAKSLSAEAVVGRLSGLDRYVVPRETVKVTAFFDPGLSVVWYAVAAWTARGGGSIIDYGCWPRQARTWFEARDARPALRDTFPGFTDPQLVYAALSEIVPEVVDRVYAGEAGGEYRIDRALIDCGWLPDAVFQFVRKRGGPLYPSKGIGRTQTSRGVSEWQRRPGEDAGYHWRLTVPQEGRVRMCQFDPDMWKTRVWELLTTPLGGVRALSLFGRAESDSQRRQSEAAHEMVAAHLAAEHSPEPMTIRGNTFDKWLKLPGDPDNHLFDCVVGAAVAAGVERIEWSATPTGEPAPKPEKRKLRWADQKRRLDAMRAGAKP